MRRISKAFGCITMALKLVIISGGQTGADRAALDWALKNDIPHGGWCPQGRLALDGTLDARYKLKETPTDDELERTEWNVRDSEASVVFSLGEKASGTAQKTVTFARKMKKPCLHLHRGVLGVSEKVVGFLEKHYVRRLNVVGASETKEPGLYDWVSEVLDKTKAVLDQQGD